MKKKFFKKKSPSGFSPISLVITIAVILLILIASGIVFIYFGSSTNIIKKAALTEKPIENQEVSNDLDDNDNDGVSNGLERFFGTDPNNPDTDGDGISDKDEVNHADAQQQEQAAEPPLDSDNDGLTDILEKFFGTDPNNPDSDGDGIGDKDEVNQ